MNDLSIFFSVALMCIITAPIMLGLIFNGKADTTPKYIISILMTAGALIVFGRVAENIVRIIAAGV